VTNNAVTCKTECRRFFDEFRRAVEAARPQIRQDEMQGQTFTGTEAKAARLADKVGVSILR
jgi:hypothetical protein